MFPLSECGTVADCVYGYYFLTPYVSVVASEEDRAGEFHHPGGLIALLLSLLCGKSRRREYFISVISWEVFMALHQPYFTIRPLTHSLDLGSPAGVPVVLFGPPSCLVFILFLCSLLDIKHCRNTSQSAPSVFLNVFWKSVPKLSHTSRDTWLYTTLYICKQCFKWWCFSQISLFGLLAAYKWFVIMIRLRLNLVVDPWPRSVSLPRVSLCLYWEGSDRRCGSAR